MAEHKKDLSTDELLKKLLTSFGGDEPQDDEGDQLTIDDAAKELERQNKPKVFRVNSKKEQAPEEQTESEELRQDKSVLEAQIRKAELFVAGMKETEEEKKEKAEKKEQASVSEEKASFSDEEDDPLASIFVDFPDIEKGPHADKERDADPFEGRQSAKQSEDEAAHAPEEEEPAQVAEEQIGSFEVQEEVRPTYRQSKTEGEFDRFEEDEELAAEDDPFFTDPFDNEPSSENEVVPVERQTEAEAQVQEIEQEQEEPHAQQFGQTEPETQSGEGVKSVEMDEKEIGILMLFGDKKKLEAAVGKEELNLRLKKLLGDADAEAIKEEYQSHDQEARFFKMLRSAYNRINLRGIVAVLLLLAVVVLELIFPMLVTDATPLEGIVGAGISEIFNNPILTALAGLQVTFLIIAVAFKEFLSGVKAFFTGRSIPQMYFTVLALFTVAYEVALLFCRNAHAPFYNLPLAITAVLAVCFTGMRVARSILSFNVVASKRQKYTVTHLTEDSANPEKEAFDTYLSEKTGVFGVGKTDFVENFAMRSAREPRYKSIVMILASISVVLGVIFFCLGYYFSKDEQLLSGLVLALQSVLLTIPASAFITYSFPFFRASKKAFSRESAIIGEFSLEEYADATVISFDDKEVFPSKNVKVRSLKLFGDTRIDHVLFGAASVFHRVGGPLDDVFGVATRESGYSDNVDILEAVAGGVEAAVDGELVRFGNSAFMRAKGLLSSVDPDDVALEMEGQLSVMYMSIGSKLAAKMYIAYGADKEIEDIMSSLYKAGMCIGIRTLDPNIDDRMISTHVDLSKYPVKVLRMDRKERELYSEKAESGVVSKKDVKSLLKTLTYCRKVLQVVRVGTVIKILGMVLGIAATALLLFLSATGRIGGVYQITSLWFALYQLCLMLPAFLISLIFV